jgi:hypothetical protein
MKNATTFRLVAQCLNQLRHRVPLDGYLEVQSIYTKTGRVGLIWSHTGASLKFAKRIRLWGTANKQPTVIY